MLKIHTPRPKKYHEPQNWVPNCPSSRSHTSVEQSWPGCRPFPQLQLPIIRVLRSTINTIVVERVTRFNKTFYRFPKQVHCLSKCVLACGSFWSQAAAPLKKRCYSLKRQSSFSLTGCETVTTPVLNQFCNFCKVCAVFLAVLSIKLWSQDEDLRSNHWPFSDWNLAKFFGISVPHHRNISSNRRQFLFTSFSCKIQARWLRNEVQAKCDG